LENSDSFFGGGRLRARWDKPGQLFQCGIFGWTWDDAGQAALPEEASGLKLKNLLINFVRNLWLT